MNEKKKDPPTHGEKVSTIFQISNSTTDLFCLDILLSCDALLTPDMHKSQQLTVLLISVTLLDANDGMNKLHFQQQADICA